MNSGPQYEIELKAHADDDAVRTRLSALGAYGGSFQKEDCYWVVPAGREQAGKAVRVRTERRVLPDGGGKSDCLVTFKIKERRLDGLEVNRETEFSVSEGAAFTGLLSWLGFAPGFCKHKTGEVWNIDGVTAELAEVAVRAIPGDGTASLGRFLELEILAGDNEAQTVEAARARLLAVLTACGLGEDSIETRYYMELAQDA